MDKHEIQELFKSFCKDKAVAHVTFDQPNLFIMESIWVMDKKIRVLNGRITLFYKNSNKIVDYALTKREFENLKVEYLFNN